MGGLGDESSIAAATVREEPSERLRSSLLSDFSLADVLLGAVADGNQSPSASVLPAGLWAYRLLGRVRTGLATGGVPVRIPETAVFGLDENDPLEGMWLTTGKDGKVERHEVDEHDIIVTLGIEMDHDHANDPDGFVAVVRTPRREGTEVRLVTAGGLKEVLNQRGGGAFAVQRLVRPAQHRSAFKNRTRWRKSAHAEAWIVTNGQPVADTHSGTPGGFLTDATGEDLFHKVPCTIVHAAGHRGAVAETAAMCGALAEHIEATARPLVRVHELVADFTRDHNGLWYLLQIKAIIATPVGPGVLSGPPNSLLPRASTAQGTNYSLTDDVGELPPPIERPTVTHTVCCRCCGRRHPPAALSQALTLRMIRSMRALQRARGVSLSWHWHFAEPSKDVNTLGQSTDRMDDQYGEMRVCSVCYDLYKAEKKLEHAAHKFSKRVGVTPDDTEGEADEEWLADAAKLADVEVQAAGEVGEAAGIEEAAKHAPLEPDEREALQGWRLLVVLHELRGRTDTLNALALDKPGHTLEFSCMGVQVKIPLSPAMSVSRGDSMPTAPSSPSSKLSPSSNSLCNNKTVSSLGHERIGQTSSGKLVMPSTDPGRSAVMMQWHRVFPFFCRRDDPASGGMSTVHESIVMDRADADTPGGAAVPDASSGGVRGASSGMLNLRAAVHELAAVVLSLRSSKRRKNVIARGQLPLGHLGVERPPELREQFVSLRISSDCNGKNGQLSTGAQQGSGLVLRLAVGLMRIERVGLEMLALRPLAQGNPQRHTDDDEEEDVDDADLETCGPESSIVATELDKLASFWNDLHDVDEATAVDRFRLDNAELSETGTLSASSGRTCLPAPSSSVLSSVSEQEFVLWWRRKMMGKKRDRRHGAIYVPPPWHCSVDPLPGVWMRAIHSGVPIAGVEQGAGLGSPVADAVSGNMRPTGARRHRRGRRRRKKSGVTAVKRATGKSRKSLAALQAGEDDDTRSAQTSKHSVGTDPATPKTEATNSQLTDAESEGEDGDTHSSTDEDDVVEIDSPALSLSSQVDFAETDVNDLQSRVSSSEPDRVCENQASASVADDKTDGRKGDEIAVATVTHSLKPRSKQRSRGKRKGKRTAVRQSFVSRGSTGYSVLAKSSRASAGTLLYWRVSLAVHGLPSKVGDSHGRDASDGLILVAELLGERLVLKIDGHGKTAQQQQQEQQPTEKTGGVEEEDTRAAADARVGSVVVYGSILELERLLSTPRRGALRGVSATCGELRLTLCSRMRADSAEVPSYAEDMSDAVHGAAEDEVGENLLHGPWRASAVGDDSSSISSIGSTASFHASEDGSDARLRTKGKVFVVGGGSVDLSTLISGGGELLRSVIIRGGAESGRLQVGVWCDPVHAPPPNMRPARPIVLGESSVCAVAYDGLGVA